MKQTFFVSLLVCWSVNTVAHGQMSLLSHVNANIGSGSSAGEIVAFDPNTDRLFVTSSGGSVFQVNIFDLSSPSTPTQAGVISFSDTFGGSPANMLALTSVAVDPLGRFGVASLVPTNNTGTVGQIGFFNLSTGAVIGTSAVGYHPDSVTFSSDGSRLIVVNEGEVVANQTNAPGSISVLNVSGINSGNLASLPGLSVTTTDFSAGNLGPGVTLSGLRTNGDAIVGTSGPFVNAVPDFTQPANIQHESLEPEYASVSGNKVFVSLQEANAIAEYDLTTNQWTAIRQLPAITQVVDASDQDGININDTVRGLPMPDTIASYTVAGKTYVVSANEGDARPEDPSRDISRFGDTGGDDSMNSGILDSNLPASNTGIRANSQLGRLNISRLDGDLDSDGLLDTPTMLGTRSFSIWEQTAGGAVLTFDSESFFEEYLRDNDPAGFVDSRSDDKGPEPEGLVLGEINGRMYAFIGMERTSGIFQFDITDPNSPFFVDYLRITTGAIPERPEGMYFISDTLSPNGVPLLIVGFEGNGSNSLTEQFAVIAVPEPGTWAMLVTAGLGLVGWQLRRRKKAAAQIAPANATG